MDTMIGRQIGRYVIDEEIGRGSMGAVYKAHKINEPDQFVAMKILLSALSSDNSFITRFNRETDALQKMKHPNVIRVFDAGQDGSMIYYVMEYISGITVGQTLKKQKKIDPLRTIEIGAQIADALDYIHSEGHLIHRDIKPDNIIVDRWSHARLLDFGLARINGLYTITRTGMVVGSLYYVPPENLHGEKIDGRADIYALGVSLYEMITGMRPFRGATLQEMSKAINMGAPVPPSVLEPDIPIECERIILKAMARLPQERYQRAKEMETDLRLLQENYTEHCETKQLSAIQPDVSTPAAAFNQPLPASDVQPVDPRFARAPNM